MNRNVPVAAKPGALLEAASTDVDMPDEEVLWALQREIAFCEVVLELAFDGDPKSKARPRIGKGGHAYTPQESAQAETRIAVTVRNAMRGHGPEGAPACFGVFVVFFTKDRQRRDVDNMLKLVMDAVTMAGKRWGFGPWVDDSQVTEVSARLVRKDGFPRTHLRIYRTIAQVKSCPVCGVPMDDRLTHCSRACRGVVQTASRQTRTDICSRCGDPIVRRLAHPVAKKPVCSKCWRV